MRVAIRINMNLRAFLYLTSCWPTASIISAQTPGLHPIGKLLIRIGEGLFSEGYHSLFADHSLVYGLSQKFGRICNETLL